MEIEVCREQFFRDKSGFFRSIKFCLRSEVDETDVFGLATEKDRLLKLIEAWIELEIKKV